MSKIKLTAAAALTLVLSLVIFFAGCAEETSSKGYEITGLKSVHLKLSDQNYDFLRGISGYKDGEPYAVTADPSGVKFGTPGKYTVTYSCGDYKIKTNVWVYALPEIAALDTTLSYTEAFNGSAKGITAQDGFGQAITPQFVGVQDEQQAPAFEYGGSYSVLYAAVDAAGQTATAARTITVSENEGDGQPEFGSVSADLSNINFAVDLDGGKLGCVLDADGAVVKEVAENAGRAVGFGPALKKMSADRGAPAAFTAVFTIYTDKGYADFTINVTDTDDPAVEYAFKNSQTGMDGYIFRVGDKANFPGLMPKFAAYQSLAFTDGVLKKGNTPVAGLSSEGDYTYSITVTKGTVDYVYEQTVKVVSNEKYLSNSYNTLSDQFLQNLIPVKTVELPASEYKQVGSSVEYAGAVADENGTAHNAVLFSNNAKEIAGWAGLGLSRQVFKEAIESGYTSLVLDVLLAEDSNIPQGQPLRVSFVFYNSRSGQSGEGGGGYIYSTEGSRKWTRLSINLVGLTATNPRGQDFYTLDADNNFSSGFETFAIMTGLRNVNTVPHKIYFANLQFAGRVTPEEKQFFTDNYISDIKGFSETEYKTGIGISGYSALRVTGSPVSVTLDTAALNRAAADGYRAIQIKIANNGTQTTERVWLYANKPVSGPANTQSNPLAPNMESLYTVQFPLDYVDTWDSFIFYLRFDFFDIESISFVH